MRLEGVSKRYGDVTALRPTDLSVIGGEFFSLLGASGPGKTTTLRLIGGFEEPTTGTIFLQGRDTCISLPIVALANFLTRGARPLSSVPEP